MSAKLGSFRYVKINYRAIGYENSFFFFFLMDNDDARMKKATCSVSPSLQSLVDGKF